MGFIVPSFSVFGKDYGKIPMIPQTRKTGLEEPVREEKVRVHIAYYLGDCEIYPDKSKMDSLAEEIRLFADKNKEVELKVNYESDRYIQNVRLAFYANGSKPKLKFFLDDLISQEGLPHLIECPILNWFWREERQGSVSLEVYNYLKEKVKERRERFVECKDGFARTGKYAPLF